MEDTEVLQFSIITKNDSKIHFILCYFFVNLYGPSNFLTRLQHCSSKLRQTRRCNMLMRSPIFVHEEYYTKDRPVSEVSALLESFLFWLTSKLCTEQDHQCLFRNQCQVVNGGNVCAVIQSYYFKRQQDHVGLHDNRAYNYTFSYLAHINNIYITIRPLEPRPA